MLTRSHSHPDIQYKGRNYVIRKIFLVKDSEGLLEILHCLPLLVSSHHQTTELSKDKVQIPQKQVQQPEVYGSRMIFVRFLDHFIDFFLTLDTFWIFLKYLKIWCVPGFKPVIWWRLIYACLSLLFIHILCKKIKNLQLKMFYKNNVLETFFPFASPNNSPRERRTAPSSLVEIVPSPS